LPVPVTLSGTPREAGKSLTVEVPGLPSFLILNLSPDLDFNLNLTSDLILGLLKSVLIFIIGCV